MATKKAKKTSKSNKKRKKNNSSNIFSKVIVILLLLSVLVAASIMAFYQIKNNIKQKDKKVEEHEEIVIVKQEDIKETSSDVKPSSSDNEPSQEEKKPHQEDIVISQDKKEIVKDDNDDEIIDIKDTFKKKQTINGFWLSMNQSASLTMDEYGYRIDYFGIDASMPMTGKYEIEGKQLIFTSDDEVCKNEKGIYKITFSDKNIILRCKSDECNKRKNVMEAEWEWIEI